jgi:hypothetical protein
MRVKALIVIAVLAFGASMVFSQGASVPISQEQHHHLIIENSYVKAYEVEVAPHESTLQHMHDFDYIYVVLGAADITNAVVGNPVVNAHLEDTTVTFVKGPLAHVAGDAGDTPFRNITISLLHKQGEVKVFYPSVKAALDAAAKGASSDSFEATLLETAEVRIKAIQVGRAGWNYSNSKEPFLVINLEKAKMFDKPGPKEKNAPSFPADLMYWYGADVRAFIPSFDVVGPNLVVLEFKD